ncbi:putative HVA22-like protein g [Forsythia ovata]|uniref:HVA22-like protein n=1 Tax=Forsythia ovata TaxID=205694 RepID=A0ABD1T8E8_9LAMI
MIGGFISRGLILVFGYAYPAFECFKTVEKNRVEIQELRFWCQYWIIVAMLTVVERFVDTFISWLPMYDEIKLALIIYLWCPKTKGTRYVYESFLRPILLKHEKDVDRSLLEFRERAWTLAIFYWQNCTQHGSEKIFQFLQFVAAKSAKITPGSQNVESQHSNGAPPPPPTPPTTPSRLAKKNDDDSPRRPITPSRPPSFNLAQSSKSEPVRVQTRSIETEDVVIQDEDTGSPMERHLHTARLKLRRFKGGN